MKNLFKIAFYILLSATLAEAQTITNYYVSPSGSDSNSGTSSSPWATIAHAGSVVGPGAIVHVAAGTYAAVTTNNSGNSSARIQYFSDTQYAAKIVSSNDGCWVNNGDYVDIMGFEVSGDCRIGIWNTASNVRIIGNKVHNTAVTGCDSNGGAGIDETTYTATNNDVIQNTVYNVGQSCPSGNTHVQGIYYQQTGGHVWNNIVYGIASAGIEYWHAATTNVAANNLVFNCNFGIVVGAGDSPGGVTNNNTVVSNNITRNNTYGIIEFGATGSGNLYLNNNVFQNTTDYSLKTGTASNTVTSDPLMVNYQSDGSGDYHLTSSSPDIGTGTSTDAPSTDFEGVTRPGSNGLYDIGPYQSGESSVNIIPDPNGTGGTWNLASGPSIVFNSTGGATQGGAWQITGNGSPAGFQFAESMQFAVSPGTTYTASAYIDDSYASGNCCSGLYIFNTGITTSYCAAMQADGANGRVTGTCTIPSGVTTVVALLDVDNVTIAGSQLVKMSNPQMEVGTTASPYSSGGRSPVAWPQGWLQ